MTIYISVNFLSCWPWWSRVKALTVICFSSETFIYNYTTYISNEQTKGYCFNVYINCSYELSEKFEKKILSKLEWNLIRWIMHKIQQDLKNTSKRFFINPRRSLDFGHLSRKINCIKLEMQLDEQMLHRNLHTHVKTVMKTCRDFFVTFLWLYM